MRATLVFPAIALVACAPHPRPAAPTPAPATTHAAGAQPSAPNCAAAETVTTRDPDLDRELARTRMGLLERTAQLAESQRRLADATTEVVRAMARSRTLATRAEAASAIAEAEVTLQQLRQGGAGAGQQAPLEARQAEEALRTASAAFDAENYGGAVYLATEAKRAATAGRGRLAETEATAGSGETPFAVPVPLVTTGRANLRAAPGGATALVSTVPAGTPLTGYAFAQDWIRVTTADGRGAWVYQGLVRGAAGAP